MRIICPYCGVRDAEEFAIQGEVAGPRPEPGDFGPAVLDAFHDYVHLRALGTPPAGRLASRAGRTAEMQAIYNGYLDNEPAAQAELAEAADIALARPSALLCLEADAKVCHRALIAARLVQRDDFEVVDL